MGKINIHIGIDPDIIKSGVAVWDSESKQFDLVKTMTFWEVINEIENWTVPVEVVIEAGWLNKPKNFHGEKIKDSAKNAANRLKLTGASRESYINNYRNKVGERTAANVGENHAVGKLFEQYCQAKAIYYRLVRPTTTKDYRKYFINKIAKLDNKNEEEIDAAFLVFQSQKIIIQ